jgi:hypothetical protein
MSDNERGQGWNTGERAVRRDSNGDVILDDATIRDVAGKGWGVVGGKRSGGMDTDTGTDGEGSVDPVALAGEILDIIHAPGLRESDPGFTSFVERTIEEGLEMVREQALIQGAGQVCEKHIAKALARLRELYPEMDLSDTNVRKLIIPKVSEDDVKSERYREASEIVFLVRFMQGLDYQLNAMYVHLLSANRGRALEMADGIDVLMDKMIEREMASGNPEAAEVARMVKEEREKRKADAQK